MTRSHEPLPGVLVHDSTWEHHDDGAEVHEWSIDPNQGLVQGPLDLSFFIGQHLVLHLQEDQVALLESDGDLKSIFFAGTHRLEISDDARQAPAARVVFLHVGAPINLRWRNEAALWIDGPGAVRCPMPFIGACSLTISDPGAFWYAFLRGAEVYEAPALCRVLDALVRSRMETHLTQLAADRATDPATLQSLLPNLCADSLNDDLQEYGLMCQQLATYTRQPPVADLVPEAAGQFAGPGDNSR